MGAGEAESSAIRDIFSGIQDLMKEPWRTLWIDRLIQYGLFFIIIFFAGIMLFGIPPFLRFDLVPTNPDNALYFLSAMVQAQAAIVTLVITLTLIAIQMASASYTPRVVDVMKKNPDMWYLLIIYVGVISYGFFALKLVSEPDRFLVSSVLILGVYTFCILFLYMKNTITLLRPDHVAEMLVNEINIENIHQEGWKKESEEDIMQPVFDLVHASINRFDVTTTRTGLSALSKRILELFPAFNAKSRGKKAKDVAEHFCNHIQRSALIALRNEDQGMLGEIFRILQYFGSCTADKGKELEDATKRVAFALGDMGIQAANRGLEDATKRVAFALGDVGIHAANSGLGDASRSVADALKDVGIRAADKELAVATEWLVIPLGDLGTHAADKGKELEYATSSVVIALREVGIHAADKGKELEDATERVAYELLDVGIHAADKGKELKYTTWNVISALREVGIHATNRGLGDATRSVVFALRELGTHAADKGKEPKDATERVAYVLLDVGIHAADKGKELEYATRWIVYGLCSLGLKESGQNAAAESLAQLIFRYKNMITKSIPFCEFELVRDQFTTFMFTTFMEKVNEKLQKLESSEKIK